MAAEVAEDVMPDLKTVRGVPAKEQRSRRLAEEILHDAELLSEKRRQKLLPALPSAGGPNAYFRQVGVDQSIRDVTVPSTKIVDNQSVAKKLGTNIAGLRPK
jgi:hypothetical protein